MEKEGINVVYPKGEYKWADLPIVISLEERPRVASGIQILPWRIFLEKLWGREFV